MIKCTCPVTSMSKDFAYLISLCVVLDKSIIFFSGGTFSSLLNMWCNGAFTAVQLIKTHLKIY